MFVSHIERKSSAVILVAFSMPRGSNDPTPSSWPLARNAVAATVAVVDLAMSDHVSTSIACSCSAGDNNCSRTCLARVVPLHLDLSCVNGQHQRQRILFGRVSHIVTRSLALEHSPHTTGTQQQRAREASELVGPVQHKHLFLSLEVQWLLVDGTTFYTLGCTFYPSYPSLVSSLAPAE